MSVSTFNVIVIVNWYVHEVYVGKAERPALFWFYEDVRPHCLCWVVSNFQVAVGNFVGMKKYLHFMCFLFLELNAEPLTLSCMVDWLS